MRIESVWGVIAFSYNDWTSGTWVPPYISPGFVYYNEGPVLYSSPIRGVNDITSGFGLSQGHPGRWGETNYGVAIPISFAILCFGVLPAIWLFKWNKRRKVGPNACSGCGYDLTGNESGVCPECGHASERETAQA